MKKIYALMILLFICARSDAQTYTLLANDLLGDNAVSFLPDVAALHYRMDQAQDSIWFKVETYTPVDPNGDAGMMFGLDTNLNIADGLAWTGNNASMNYDLGLLVFQNIFSPGYYGYTYCNTGSAPIPVQVQRPDSFTFIVSAQLSLLDGDGTFHLLFGAGAFDILATQNVYDDVPNSGFLTVNGATGINEIDISSMYLFPNPVENYLKVILKNPLPGTSSILRIFDSAGKEIGTPLYIQSEILIPVSTLDAGIYFLQLTDSENKIHCSTRFIKYPTE